jgi:flagellar hook protein FlgE
VDSLNSAAYTPQETDEFGPAYGPTDTDINMASGNISSHFSRPIRIFDAQGGGHDLNLAFLKIDINTWSIEVYAVPASDISSSLPDGLVAYGNVSFNGDGTLRSIDTTLSEDVDITWTNGASASTVNFNLGTAGQPFGTVGATTFGLADGLSQFNASYKVNFANQNGAPVGELTGVSINELGIISASYSNGEAQQLYQIPLAEFANPDQLESSSGNVFEQTAESGEFNLRQAGSSGVGKVAASSLEASNVELSSELTDMIIAQRSYQANAKVISTADSMLEELNRIIQ